MSARILPFQKKVTARHLFPGTPDAPHYFCLKCDADTFKAYPGGAIHCTHCGARMGNLRVVDLKATS